MSLSATGALPPLHPFSLTHIVYDPSHPLSIPFTLLSLSPIFLFVSYFTLIIFTRRLTVTLLALGSVFNEILSLGLKKVLKGDRPFKGIEYVGEGWGMPSSHSQAAGFLFAWGVGYSLTIAKREERGDRDGDTLKRIRTVRNGIYVFGLGLWSVLVAYSRYHLHYHSPIQVIAGYIIGLLAGSVYFILTEYIPLHHPTSIPGRIRARVEYLWTGIGGVGGWRLGDAPGGWGEGSFFVMPEEGKRTKGS